MNRNVLQLVSSFRQGGSERQAVQLVRLLHESGRFQVHVACLDREGTLRAEVERLALGETPEFALTSFYDANFVRQLNRFARFLREHEIAVLHTHDFYTNIFGILGATLARVPVRIASRREITGWRSRAQKRIERIIYRAAHAIVANAEAVKDHLVVEGVPPRKIKVVYNGMDMGRVGVVCDLDRGETLAALGILAEARNQRFVTIVANMHHPVKDQHTFLRAARRVSAEVPAAGFILAGEGELKDSLQAFAAELGLNGNAFFIGRCANVAELLAVSEVCVLSSTSEGFSNSILEYMAAARPVVATDVGGAREAIVEGETGYLVPAGDDALMAERLIALLKDGNLGRTMGERGRRRVEELFSCEAQLRRTETLYDELLAHEGMRAGSPRLAKAGREGM